LRVVAVLLLMTVLVVVEPVDIELLLALAVVAHLLNLL
jgi:hypothetical protein